MANIITMTANGGRHETVNQNVTPERRCAMTHLNRKGLATALMVAAIAFFCPALAWAEHQSVAAQWENHLKPEHWYWMVAMFFAAYLMLYSIKVRTWTIGIGLIVFLLQGISILYQRLEGWQLWLGIALAILVNLGIFAFIVVPIVWVWSKTRAAVNVGVSVAKAGMHAAEAMSHGLEEESKTFKKVMIFLMAFVTVFPILFTLFGGKLPENWSEWSQLGRYQAWIVFLRGIGLIISTIGLIMAVWDAFHAGWLCRACGKWNWDRHQDEVMCNGCGAWNPKTDWMCECGQTNSHKFKRCQNRKKNCGKANPLVDKDGRPKRQDFEEKRKWVCGAIIQRKDGPAACGHVNPADSNFCQSAACGAPNTKWDCAACGQVDIAGNYHRCPKCGQPRPAVVVQPIAQPAPVNPAPQPAPQGNRVQCPSCQQMTPKGRFCKACGGDMPAAPTSQPTAPDPRPASQATSPRPPAGKKPRGGLGIE